MSMRNKCGFRKSFVACITLLMAVLGVSHCSARSAAADKILLAQGLDAGQLTDILTAADVARSSTGIKAINSGAGVTVLAQTKPDATDRGLKVDAVFIAKTLFQLADAQVQRVKVIFSETGKPGRYVALGKAEIDAYGTGKITADQLLLRVRLISVNDEPVTPNLASGPQYERRLLVWQRIDSLKKKGTGVKPFETLFADVETAVTAGDTGKVSERLSYLEEKISAQEKQVKLAKQAASGRGMRGYQSSAGASHQGAPMPNTMGASGGEPVVPANSDWIRQQFNEQAPGALQRASGTSANTLRQLKTAIDQAFASNKKGAAFQMIHQFQQEAMRATGVDIMMPSGGPPGGMQPPGGGGHGGGQPGGGGGPPGGGPPGF